MTVRRIVSIDELKAIFNAGRDFGEEQATSYQWGVWAGPRTLRQAADDAFFEACRDLLCVQLSCSWVEDDQVRAFINGRKS